MSNRDNVFRLLIRDVGKNSNIYSTTDLCAMYVQLEFRIHKKMSVCAAFEPISSHSRCQTIHGKIIYILLSYRRQSRNTKFSSFLIKTCFINSLWICMYTCVCAWRSRLLLFLQLGFIYLEFFHLFQNHLLITILNMGGPVF